MLTPDNQSLRSNGHRTISTFLQPYLFPQAGKKSKPIPDWLFLVSEADRAALDKIEVFGAKPATGSSNRVAGDASGLVASEEYGSPLSTPGSATSEMDNMDRARAEYAEDRNSEDEQDDDAPIEWTSTPEVRRFGASRHDAPPTDSDQEVEHDESVDVLIPARPPTASPGVMTSTAANESLHLYPRQNIARSATPAVLKGVAGARRNVETPYDEAYRVSTSQMSNTSDAASFAASSGQSMVVKPARESVDGRTRRMAESLEMMQRHVASPSAHSSSERTGLSAGSRGDAARRADERRTSDEEEEDIEMEGDGLRVPSATMPFPPAGQKRGSSLFMESPTGRRPDRTEGNPSQEGHSLSEVPLSLSDPANMDEDGQGHLSGNIQPPVMTQHGIPQTPIVSPARQASREIHASQSKVDANASSAEAAATRTMPTASQQTRASRPSSHHAPASFISSSPMKADTSFDLTISPARVPDHGPHSLESNKTATSLPASGSASGSTTNVKGHASTSTAATASSSRIIEGQRPIPSRGGQTSWIHMSPMASMYDVNGQGKGKGLVREPTASLSQSQSQEGDMSLSRYASKTKVGGASGVQDKERAPVRAVPEEPEQRVASVREGDFEIEGSGSRPSRPAQNGSPPEVAEEGYMEPTKKRKATTSPRRKLAGPLDDASTRPDAPPKGFTSNSLDGPGVPARSAASNSDTGQAARIDSSSALAIKGQGAVSHRQHQNAVAGPSRMVDRFPLVDSQERPVLRDRHPAIQPVKRPSGITSVQRPSAQSPEDRKPRVSELDVKPILDPEGALVDDRSSNLVKSEILGGRVRDDREGPAFIVKSEHATPATEHGMRSGASRRSSRPRRRPPLLNGFQPDLRVQLGEDMAWLMGEMQEVDDLRRAQGLF